MASTSTNRRQGVNSGAAVKVPCRCATTANITLSGEQTIDGVAVVADDRVLVKDQTTGADNGIYVASTSTWQRALDWDGTFDVVQGTLTPVANGTVNGGLIFRVTTANPITIGTTSVAMSSYTTNVSDGDKGDITVSGSGTTWTIDSGAVTTAWTGVVAGSGSGSTLNGDSDIVYQVAQTTASRISWRFTESTASVSTGTPVLFQVDTIASSTALPFLVKARGTEVFRVPAAGGQIQAADGSTAAPAYSFASQAGMGMSLTTSDILGFYVGGARVMDVRAGANVFLPHALAAVNFGADADLIIVRDAAHILAQRSGTNAQELRVYNTFTSVTNYEFGKLEWASNVLRFGTEKGSGGGTARDLVLITDDTERLRIHATNPWLIQDEADANPTTTELDADDSIAIYNKSDKFVIAYNNGGTITYISIPLDGSTTTWTHSTSAP